LMVLLICSFLMVELVDSIVRLAKRLASAGALALF